MAEEMDTNQSADKRQKTVAGFLADALDMEDRVSSSVYRDYMDEKYWPKNLKPEIFKNIQEYLTILIEDTEKHRKIILALMQKYGQDK
jgi:PhoPQ-activated pathogenicity-related protein